MENAYCINMYLCITIHICISYCTCMHTYMFVLCDKQSLCTCVYKVLIQCIIVYMTVCICTYFKKHGYNFPFMYVCMYVCMYNVCRYVFACLYTIYVCIHIMLMDGWMVFISNFSVFSKRIQSKTIYIIYFKMLYRKTCLAYTNTSFYIGDAPIHFWAYIYSNKS